MSERIRPKLQARRPGRLSHETLANKRLVIEDKSQVRRKARAHRFVFLDFDQYENIESQANKTAAIASKVVKPALTPIPNDADAAIIVCQVDANTATGGIANLHFLGNVAAANIGQSASAQCCPMVSASFRTQQQHIVPITDGGFYYEVNVSGTVNYTLNIYLVGWVMA